MGNCNCDSSTKPNPDNEISINHTNRHKASKNNSVKNSANNSMNNNPSINQPIHSENKEKTSVNKINSKRSVNNESVNYSMSKHIKTETNKSSSIYKANSISEKFYQNPQVKLTIGTNIHHDLPEIEIENIGNYLGQWKNGKRDGKGVFKWTDG